MQVEVFQGKGKPNNSWRWRVRAANRKIVASSGEAFASKRKAVTAIYNFAQQINGLMTGPADKALIKYIPAKKTRQED